MASARPVSGRSYGANDDKAVKHLPPATRNRILGMRAD
jgi:hypothetical protein